MVVLARGNVKKGRENMLVESHAHLDDEAFDEDREELIKEIQKQGIGCVMNVGSSLASVKTSIALAESHEGIYAAAGIHPSETGELNEENFRWLKEQLSSPRVKAVGEIGLDYHWPEPDRQLQQYWFRRQLQLAHEAHLPIIIHSREAAADTRRIMEEEGADRLRGVIHCFSYTKETARGYLNWNYYFGIGGVVTFQNAKKLKEAVAYIPLENILLETDSPYLAPTPYRGKRNSPLNLPLIAQAIAEIKGIDAKTVIETTGQNAKTLYALN
jgi:TatD DNase family protein